MQIVIDIDDKLYEIIKDPNKLSTMYHASKCAEAVRNGIPIPKGHGDIIDRDELYFLKAIHDAKFEKISWADAIKKIKYSAPTIVKGVI